VDLTHRAPRERGVLRQGQLDQVGLALPQCQQPHEVADRHGLLDHGGQHAWRGHRHVDTPRVVEQPLVRRVVHPRHHAPHGEHGLREQGDHEVDLVVAGGRDDHVAQLHAGVLQRRQLARVREHPLGLLDRVRLVLALLPLDEHHLVLIGDQLRGDGPSHGAGARDRHPHQDASSGGWAAALVTSLTVPDSAAT
jgi:hypothetical protein